MSRFPSRWGRGDERRTRLALFVLLTLRGTPFLYYGDEIGMTDRGFDRSEVKDPVGVRFHPVAGRDPERTPMQWSAGEGAGFTQDGVNPWLPFGANDVCNVDDQRGDPTSMLNLTHDLIALRRSRDDLRSGRYERVDAPEGVWAFRRGDSTVVWLNMSDHPTSLGVSPATILVSSARDRDGQSVGDELSLGPWEAVVASV